MRLRPTNFLATALIGSALMTTGCATVDLNDMAKPSVNSAAQPEVNIVQRAALKLKNAFKSKGFVAKTSRKRMQSAAKILLNGLEDKNVRRTDDNSGYAATPKTTEIVLADMAFARQHVIKTTQAAEIYLEMAPADRKLREELSSLETALIAANEAGRVFETALGGASQTQLDNYTRSVENLSVITDEFGARVRMQQAEKLAMRGSAI